MAKITYQQIKPRLVTGATKADVVSKARGGIFGHAHFSIRGDSKNTIQCYVREEFGRRDNAVAILFNLHKLRRKTKIVETKTKGGKIKRTVEKVRDNHWIAYVYTVPLTMIKSAVQHDRNFELVIGA